MAGRHLEEEVAPDAERTRGGTAEAPLVDHSPWRGAERPRPRRGGAWGLARHELEMARHVGAESRFPIGAHRPGEAGDVERREPDGDERFAAADVPGGVRRRPIVRSGLAGDEDERDREPPHDHGRLAATSI